MKKIIILIAYLLTWPVFAHEVEPAFIFDGGSCSVWGYTNLTFGTDNDFMASQLRARIACSYKGFSSVFEGDIAPLLQPEKFLEHHPANYLTQGWIAYTWKEALWGNMFSNTMLKVGRFQTAAGMATPPLYEVITVQKPYGVSMLTLYGTGASISTAILPELTFTADITGGTGYSFNDRRSNFAEGGIELSQLLRWIAIKDGERNVLSLSIMNQSGTYIQRNGVYFKWSPRLDLDLYGGIFMADTHYPMMKQAQSFGAYILGDYDVGQFQAPVIHKPLDLRVHSMGDYLTGPTEYRGVTLGTQLVLPKNSGYGRLTDSSLTVDAFWESLQLNPGAPVKSGPGVMIRLRIFF